MPKGWISKRVGELGRVVTGKTPSTKISENFGGPYPFITIPDLDGRVYISETSRTLSELGARAIQGAQLPAGAVLISCIATIGRCGITSKPSFTNQQINSVIPNNTVDARFLYYVFTQLGKELERAGGGGIRLHQRVKEPLLEYSGSYTEPPKRTTRNCRYPWGLG